MDDRGPWGALCIAAIPVALGGVALLAAERAVASFRIGAPAVQPHGGQSAQYWVTALVTVAVLVAGVGGSIRSERPGPSLVFLLLAVAVTFAAVGFAVPADAAHPPPPDAPPTCFVRSSNPCPGG